MIDQTFLHCPGIGPISENKLRECGLLHWQDCLLRPENIPFSKIKTEKLLSSLLQSKEALETGNIGFFTDHLPNREHWRILAQYFKEATFFDIETTGLSFYDSITTVITAFYHGKLYSYVLKENLDDFLDLVGRSTLLVSFNGSSFDIPFLEKSFNLPSIGCPHVDLRWILYHRGYTGGLKTIEKTMGIQRPSHLRDIDGFEAIILYYKWQGGDVLARNQLVEYCQADTISTYLVAANLLASMGCIGNSEDLSGQFSLINPIR